MTLIKDLLQRRVPQILGIYLATSWAIIEFLDWFINHYSISPHLSEFGLITLASLIPSVLMIAYFHGKPGKDTWTKTEKIGIPVNVAGAMLLLFFLFKGKELGATTSLVSVEDEEGQLIERMIPKSEFRKKIMLFFLENQSGDTALNWLAYAIPDMLHTDLTQDYFMEVKTVYHSTSARERMSDAGFTDFAGLPLMLEKEVAGKLHLDYFLTGAFTKREDRYEVQAELYRTRNGRLIGQHTLGHTNLMSLVDELTVELKRDLEVPEYHLEDVEDLPVSEITTSSLDAFRWYILGSNQVTFHRNWEGTIRYLHKAVEEDPTFAMAYYVLYTVYVATNQSEKGAYLFDNLMDQLYKLPEKMQYQVKASYFELMGEYDKQYAVFEMLVNLYPEDIEARLNHIFFLVARNQIEEAIAQYKTILELDPERYAMLKEIGTLYEQSGNYEDALQYYQRYAEHLPDDPESFRLVGGLHLKSGEFEEARANYERALVLEPDHVSDLLQLADIACKTGHFEQASRQFQHALNRSDNPREKVEVYDHLANFHELRGEQKKALESLYLKYGEWDKQSNPLYVTSFKISTINQLARLEKKDVVFQFVRDLEAELDTLLGGFGSLGYLYYYLEQEEMDEAERYISKVEELISNLRLDILQPVVSYSRGKIHELRGEYKLAVQYYQEQMKMVPANPQIPLNLGICYRELSDYNKAQEHLEKALVIHPYLPQAHYEMALVYRESGKGEKALPHLRTAVDIWEHADPDFEPAVKARRKLAEWGRP